MQLRCDQINEMNDRSKESLLEEMPGLKNGAHMKKDKKLEQKYEKEVRQLWFGINLFKKYFLIVLCWPNIDHFYL